MYFNAELSLIYGHLLKKNPSKSWIDASNDLIEIVFKVKIPD